jgi:hypothetical protein
MRQGGRCSTNRWRGKQRGLASLDLPAGRVQAGSAGPALRSEAGRQPGECTLFSWQESGGRREDPSHRDGAPKSGSRSQAG